MYTLKKENNAQYVVIDKFEEIEGLRHVFSTKDILNIDIKEIVTSKQVHGDNIYIVKDGHSHEEIKNVDADALLTNEKRVSVGVFTADCIPVLLVDPVKGAIGAVHAGREGTIREIVKKTVSVMSKQYGSLPGDLFAAIGPGIGRCCYAVSEAIGEKIMRCLPYWRDMMFSYDGYVYLDLPEANRIQLLKSGILESNIFSTGLCTSCNSSLFFSYRREKGKTGRMISYIRLE